ncbi:Hypothetical_protein [Hexamita inflata]|uniref:Hypothetical_protein n=1 Tax=Hexamita inflata TaxID=28002 RepID=A0AA86R6X0_9EUKA|nr:Hypothetical protein HINF_LOCUS54817 [Hexamita inflata]
MLTDFILLLVYFMLNFPRQCFFVLLCITLACLNQNTQLVVVNFLKDELAIISENLQFISFMDFVKPVSILLVDEKHIIYISGLTFVYQMNKFWISQKQKQIDQGKNLTAVFVLNIRKIVQKALKRVETVVQDPKLSD